MKLIQLFESGLRKRTFSSAIRNRNMIVLSRSQVTKTSNEGGGINKMKITNDAYWERGRTLFRGWAIAGLCTIVSLALSSTVLAKEPAYLQIIANWKYNITGVYVSHVSAAARTEWSGNLLRSPVRAYGGSCKISLPPGRYNLKMRVDRKERPEIEHGINTTRGNRGLLLRSGQTFTWCMD